MSPHDVYAAQPYRMLRHDLSTISKHDACNVYGLTKSTYIQIDVLGTLNPSLSKTYLLLR